MNDFARMSRYAGMREDLVQAGGGNSSWKIDDNQMLIKASGYQLADVSDQKGFAVVNFKMIRDAFLSNRNLDDMTDDESKKILSDAFISGSRPSIETFLHSISGRYTLHTHPIVVNALTCRKEWKKDIVKLFPEALLVPYATPGADLAKEYFKAYKARTSDSTKVFEYTFLQNHGLVVTADTAELVIDRTEIVIRRIEEYLGCNMDEYHRVTELWKYFPEDIVWEATDHHIFEAAKEMGNFWDVAFCPDCVVFLGKKILSLRDNFDEEDIRNFEKDNGKPSVILWKSHFYLLAESVRKAFDLQSVMSFSAQVMLLNKGQQCSLLSVDEQNHLLNWDAEKYRKALNN